MTLSACETALGREAGGEGFVGFTQALLMLGARSVCLSLWKVDDTATALLMRRFYANLLGKRPGLANPLPKAETLREAKVWLRGLSRSEALAVTADLSGGVERSKGAQDRQPGELSVAIPADDRPYAAPHFWAAFVLAGDPDCLGDPNRDREGADRWDRARVHSLTAAILETQGLANVSVAGSCSPYKLL